MASRKKLTMKEVDNRLNILLKEIVNMQSAITNAHQLFLNYVTFNKNVDKFTEFLNKKAKEANESTDNKQSSKGNASTDKRKQSSKKRKQPAKVSAK